MHYRTEFQWFGLPFVHIAIGPAPGSGRSRGVAKGWIAIGDISFGLLLSLGGVSFGGIALGGLSVGVLAFAGMSVGYWAFGGLAIGVYALGGAAIALRAAVGGLAVAGEYALGGQATGTEANTDAARAYFEASPFFRVATGAARHSRWFLVLPILLPLFLWLANRRRDPQS